MIEINISNFYTNFLFKRYPRKPVLGQHKPPKLSPKSKNCMRYIFCVWTMFLHYNNQYSNVICLRPTLVVIMKPKCNICCKSFLWWNHSFQTRQHPLGALYQRVRELGQRMELTLFISQSLLKTLPMTEEAVDAAASEGPTQGGAKQHQRWVCETLYLPTSVKELEKQSSPAVRYDHLW